MRALSTAQAAVAVAFAIYHYTCRRRRPTTISGPPAMRGAAGSRSGLEMKFERVAATESLVDDNAPSSTQFAEEGDEMFSGMDVASARDASMRELDGRV